MAVPGQRYRSANDAEHLAAVELQAAARGAHARRRARRAGLERHAAEVVTRRAKTYVASHERVRKLEELSAAEEQAWARLCEQFRERWPILRDAPRVVVHVPSLSMSEAQRLSTPDLEVRQNAQLPRLCDVRQPGVDAVYVAPFALNDDVTQYFTKVL